jgi:ketopantoate reductase
MKSSGIVNGMAFYRQSFRNEHKTLGHAVLGHPVTTQKKRSHKFVFAGIYAVNDAGASANTLQAMLESLADKFDDNLTLNGTAESHDLFQLDAVYYSEPGEYGDNIYHLFEASLTANEIR